MGAWTLGVALGIGCWLWALPMWAVPEASPSPLGIKAVTVEVVPLQAPPGLSLPAPAADRVEAPPHLRSFRAAPRAGSPVRPTVTPTPSPAARRTAP